jgi:hypothetical protein
MTQRPCPAQLLLLLSHWAVQRPLRVLLCQLLQVLLSLLVGKLLLVWVVQLLAGAPSVALIPSSLAEQLLP